MLRLLNYLLVFILVAASSPDEVLGACFEDCESSVSQTDTAFDQTIQKMTDMKKQSDSHPDHDCNCPVHSHHCCNHVSLVSFANPSAVYALGSVIAVKHLFVESFMSEPSADGLFRPPIV